MLKRIYKHYFSYEATETKKDVLVLKTELTNIYNVSNVNVISDYLYVKRLKENGFSGFRIVFNTTDNPGNITFGGFGTTRVDYSWVYSNSLNNATYNNVSNFVLRSIALGGIIEVFFGENATQVRASSIGNGSYYIHFAYIHSELLTLYLAFQKYISGEVRIEPIL